MWTNRRELWIIFLIMVTEVFGFSLILPFLPFLAQDMGATPLIIGLILTSFSLFQFISAPIMGRLSDTYGRKPLLIFSQFSTMIGYVILAYAGSLWMILLSRIVDGLLGSNFTIAQAYVSDITSKKDRSKAFGLTSAAFGFGFAVGPALGGFLSQYGYAVPSLVAAGLSLTTIILTIFMLPETVTAKNKRPLDGSLFPMKEFVGYFQNSVVSSKLWRLFAIFLSHAMIVGMFALYTERMIGFGPQQVGYVLGYVGIAGVLIRVILLPKLIDKIGERTLQYTGFVLLILCFLGMFVVGSWQLFIVLMTLMVLGMSLLRPIIMGEISRSVPENMQGSIMGVTSSIQSISQIVGPLVGGFIITYMYAGYIGLLSAVFILCGFVFLVREDLFQKKL